MIWLSWRQFRTQAAVVFAALAVLAVLVVITGLRLRDLYDASGIAGCAQAGDCDTVTAAFTSNYSWLQHLLMMLLLFLPAVTGAFWGAPLIAREFETGTHQLAWTQSVTRTRWLAAKIAVVGTASVAASAALSWQLTWWFTPLDKVSNKFDPLDFSLRDIAPLGYAAFAFALGLVAGLLVRRTLPAMAATLVGYIAARIAVQTWIRPHFAAPLQATMTLQPPSAGQKLLLPQIPPGSWMLSERITDASGHTGGPIRITPSDPCVANDSCLAGYRHTLTYQPASRYWPFQWDETVLFFGVAAILIGFSFWWITGHRLPHRTPRTGSTATRTGETSPTRPAAASVP